MVDVAAALGTVKLVAGIATDAQRIDLTAQVIGLQQTLLGLLAENLALSSKVAELEGKLRERESQLQRQEEFVFDRNAYWIVSGETSDGPFCSRCFDVDDKPVRMHPTNNGYFKCPACKTLALVNPDQRPSTTGPRRVRRTNWMTGWREGY